MLRPGQTGQLIVGWKLERESFRDNDDGAKGKYRYNLCGQPKKTIMNARIALAFNGAFV